LPGHEVKEFVLITFLSQFEPNLLNVNGKNLKIVVIKMIILKC